MRRMILIGSIVLLSTGAAAAVGMLPFVNNAVPPSGFMTDDSSIQLTTDDPSARILVR